MFPHPHQVHVVVTYSLIFVHIFGNHWNGSPQSINVENIALNFQMWMSVRVIQKWYFVANLTIWLKLNRNLQKWISLTLVNIFVEWYVMRYFYYSIIFLTTITAFPNVIGFGKIFTLFGQLCCLYPSDFSAIGDVKNRKDKPILLIVYR